jgi:hypothetical protein
MLDNTRVGTADGSGKNNRYHKNMTNYTYGGKTPIESGVKREIEIRSNLEESFYPTELKPNKYERVGTSTYAKRL